MNGPTPLVTWTPPRDVRPVGRRRIVLGCLVVVLLLAVAIVLVAALLLPSLNDGLSVVQASRGELDGVRVWSDASGQTVVFQAARGIDLPDGPRLACTVVKPNLVGTSLAHAHWTIVNRAGDVIGSNETPCPSQ